MEPARAKKSLGQNWLRDEATLDYIVQQADLDDSSFVLEIGPGRGALTQKLAEVSSQVLAIEIDQDLIAILNKIQAHNLKIEQGDFLQFNLDQLPVGYKVVANVPYYITSKIVQKLLTAENRPTKIVLLVQKEVAQRLAAGPGEYSVLGISAQVYAQVELGAIVPAESFEPVPKVDSQVVILNPKNRFNIKNEKVFFRAVKAGFSERRKKLRSSLAGGLHLSKPEVEDLLKRARVNSDLRAQDLSISDWLKITDQLSKN
jgi:16S rRNA (adenine1518-N6/adenine1519-N6)-dimethyltransferase